MKGTSLDPSSACHADDDRIRPYAVAAPAKRWNLVSHLHETRPGIICKLDLDYRLISVNRHATGDTDNARFGKRRVLHSIRIETREAARHTEDTAFGIGDVLAPHHDLAVAFHLFSQTAIEGLNHGDRTFRNVLRRLLFEHRRSIAIDRRGDMSCFRLRSGVRFIGSLTDFRLDGAPKPVHAFPRHDPMLKQIRLSLRDGITFARTGKFVFTA